MLAQKSLERAALKVWMRWTFEEVISREKIRNDLDALFFPGLLHGCIFVERNHALSAWTL